MATCGINGEVTATAGAKLLAVPQPIEHLSELLEPLWPCFELPLWPFWAQQDLLPLWSQQWQTGRADCSVAEAGQEDAAAGTLPSASASEHRIAQTALVGFVTAKFLNYHIADIVPFLGHISALPLCVQTKRLLSRRE